MSQRVLEDYVEDCVYITAKEAIEMIGTHGGYVEITPEGTRYTSKTFDIDLLGLDPTSHEALSVSSDWHIPYWNYMSSENTCGALCEFDSQRPPLLKTQGSDSIEAQIDRYIIANLDECLADFEDFEIEGFAIEPLGNMSARTVITDTNVLVFMEYPFEVSFEDVTSKVTQYIVDIDVNLKKIYNLASEITTLSVTNKFLEQHALNLIAGFSGIDEDALPPLTGTDFSFVSKRWIKSEVTQKLQDMLTVYINILQATRTENFNLNYFPDNDLKTGLYSHMVLPLEDNHYDTSVDFNYLGWPIYFFISPGEVIRAREGVAVPLLSLFIPFQRYDLPYDVSFPVMVELRDKTAFAANGKLYRYTVMAMGLKNSSPSCQRLMDRTFAGLAHTDSYIDDIAVYSSQWKQHLQDLEESLCRIKSAEFTVNPRKCKLGYNSLTFLGVCIGQGINQTDHSKIRSMQEMSAPRTKHEVRSLLGMTGYYRRFIPRYSDITAPLTELT